MIELKAGNILAENAEALVNTVNCVGIMGRGIALQFKTAFSENFEAYKAACKRGEVQPGRMFVFATGQLTNPRYIINFPTKRHWRGKSRLSDIEAGLTDLVAEIKARNIRSVAVPPLGSGLGGLDWSDVRSRIEAAAHGIPNVRVVIFEPRGAPEAWAMPRCRVPLRTRAPFFKIIQRPVLAPIASPIWLRDSKRRSAWNSSRQCTGYRPGVVRARWMTFLRRCMRGANGRGSSRDVKSSSLSRS